MTCNITTTPHIAEPLPLYRRDPETASILSSAPSYVSDAPTYSSNRPDAAPQTSQHPAASPANSRSTITTPSQSTVNLNQQNTTRNGASQGLPNRAFAPGWRAPANGTLSELDAHNYDMINWSNVRSSGTHRTYHNVAQRRASAATANALNTFAANSSSTNLSTTSINLPSAEVSFPRSPEPTPHALDATAITTPLEDPYLVGEIAAKKARQARLYREMCLRGEEAVRYEGKSWDFMVKQLEDEEERSRQWRRFKEQALLSGGGAAAGRGGKVGGGGKLLGTRGRLMRRLGSGSWS